MSEAELREKIHSALFADDFPILNDIEKDAVDRVVAIIQQAQKADRKRGALEARIDTARIKLEEVERIPTNNFSSVIQYKNSRIAYIKSKLKALEKEEQS